MRLPVTRSHLLAALLIGLLAVPLVWSLWQAGAAAASGAAWQALWTNPQTLPAWAASLWTGLASTALAAWASAGMLSRNTARAALQRLVQRQGWMLAVPHAAFAIGLALLIAPSGWLLRLFSPWATGLQAPPPWPTTQDPWGLGLIAVLALKEIPFLLWAAGAHLLRPDVAQRLGHELNLAATLGYGPSQAWWRVVWPQLLPRMAAPLLAVLAYSLTVVDVAQVIGPATPPTLAVLAWQWLQDADALQNAQGAAAAWLLAATVAASAALGWALLQAPLWRRLRTQGARVHPLRAPLHAHRPPQPRQTHNAKSSATLLAASYLAVLAALLLGSLIGSWPFPNLWPAQWTLAAWHSVAESRHAVGATLWLGMASAAIALAWCVAWLELAPARWHARMHTLVYVPLLLPALLWVVGQHRLALSWGLDASATGVWLTHVLACLPYVLLTLQGAYTGFDSRLYGVAATLGHSRWAFVWRIKWPLLRASLAAAFAVGFAVSVAQYLPTLYVGAGRFATVTTEAVALAAGGQRSLMAAFAWLQWLLPALVFAAAAWLARGRGFRPVQSSLGTIGT